MKLEHMKVWRDEEFREASLEMALDHAILDHSLLTGEAIGRFYAWNAPAVTVGYFHQMENHRAENESPIRRYTGGGLVEHGDDITFTLIFPAGSSPAKATSATRYKWIHSYLAESLAATGFRTTPHQDKFQNGAQPCFQHAVSDDLIDQKTGEKICGGAQRRCKGAVIHQGSIRLPEALRDLKSSWIGSFLSALSAEQEDITDDEKAELTRSAIVLQNGKYGTAGWNLRR